jgi:prophage antirepressor-like protein
MKIERFEDIEAWQLARELARIMDLSNISKNMKKTKPSTVNRER